VVDSKGPVSALKHRLQSVRISAWNNARGVAIPKTVQMPLFSGENQLNQDRS
jgi:hypothetical protein